MKWERREGPVGATPPTAPRRAERAARGRVARGRVRGGTGRRLRGRAAMAVDITLLFKASVKTVKTRNKALGVAAGDSARDELLKRSATRSKSDFTSRAREVISHIGKLKDFLLQHRKDYINAYSHIMSDYVRMTDTERDQIDQDAQIFMRTCADAIHQLRTEAHKGVQSAQVKEHRTAVLDFIEDYLKRVCKLYSEQRAIRVKRVIDKKRLSRLEPEQSNVSKSPLSPEKSSQNPVDDSEEKLSAEESKDRNLPDAQSNLGLWGDGKGEDELSPEEIQMFEQENQRLVGEMNNLFDEVRQIEGKVVEISRLQEIFTEKVLQQETDIDNIHQLVVGATENIKEGNEDIREAIKNNAGFRVWILFFLVMCSFSLLFLDWYDN
ncbi:syntaxin-18 isoform X1 [Balearica regulorum gibbericeps]|uniref:syntaxin-18 isoform X1 n=1 Tax=Balearica regulorum gibbericeps TaxID=100784 RepID=UPI003F606007